MQLPKPSAIRNYLYEYVLIGLVTAVVTLFWMYVKLQGNVNANGTANAVVMQQIIKDNTNALQQFMNYRRGMEQDLKTEKPQQQ